MRLLILDRDGVINEDSDAFIKSPLEWHPIPGSLEAIARASHAGCRIVVASNQSGLARGLLDIDALNQIHQRLVQELAVIGGNIDAFFFCPHGPDDNCECRKPKTGMLEEISRRLRVPLTDVPVVADRLSDVQAARSVGARPILVLTGRGKQTLHESGDTLSDIAIFPDLAAVVDHLLTLWNA